MTMQNQLQKLSDAAAALEASPARARLRRLFDEGSFVELDRLAKDGDQPAEVVIGYGTVEGGPAFAFAQDRTVCRGAVGKAQAAKILKVYRLAAQNGAPVVGVYDSDGARLGEGVDAMDALAEILAASNNISGVVPQIAVLAGPCIGSSAVAAAGADVVIAAKGADYYLNPGDENADAAITAADADEAVDKARALLALLPANNLEAPATYDFDGAPAECGGIDTVMEAVADPGTLLPLFEGHRARMAFARVNGSPAGLVSVSTEKICDDGAARLARFVRLCDSFSLPVVTFVDFGGFRGVRGAAKLSHAYAEATTAKITVITGKAYGPAYIAVAGKSAGADAVLAWPTATVLPLAPEAAIHIFWKDRLEEMKNPTEDRARLAAEYAETEGNALKAAEGGYVTDVVDPEETKARIAALLDMLAGKRVSRLPKKHSNMVL